MYESFDKYLYLYNEDMNKELCVFDWDAEFEVMSVDECFDRFLEILGVLVSKHIPIRDSDCSKKPSSLFPSPRSFMRLRTSTRNIVTGNIVITL